MGDRGSLGAAERTHVVAVAVGADLGLVDQGGLDVRQVPFLLRVAELGEDLLLVRVALVLERDHLIRGAELRVSAAARQLRHGAGFACLLRGCGVSG